MRTVAKRRERKQRVVGPRGLHAPAQGQRGHGFKVGWVTSINCTRRWLMARPRPVPPMRRVAERRSSSRRQHGAQASKRQTNFPLARGPKFERHGVRAVKQSEIAHPNFSWNFEAVVDPTGRQMRRSLNGRNRCREKVSRLVVRTRQLCVASKINQTESVAEQPPFNRADLHQGLGGGCAMYKSLSHAAPAPTSTGRPHPGRRSGRS
jgi:hypothetical protein